MVTREELVKTVAGLNRLTDTGALEEILSSIGIEKSDGFYVAEQRALRMYAQLTGQVVPRDEVTMSVVKLRPGDGVIVAAMAAMWIEGLSTGLALDRK